MREIVITIRLIILTCSFIAMGARLQAQFSISGRIMDSSNKTALVGATVFLSNATKGTTTGADGTFLLSNVKPGQYDLVISMIGYQAFSTSLLINSNQQDLRVELARKATTLRPYVVMPDKVRQRYYEMFKSIFIGRIENSAYCKIVNPEIIYFDFDKTQNTLSASTDDFLIIENAALGYRIKFLLRIFTSNFTTGGNYLSYYEGQALFEEMQGGNAKKRRWERNRVDAYLGSSMHFFRAAVANKLSADGFIMHSLARVPNKDRPPDDSIRLALSRLRHAAAAGRIDAADSIAFWQRKSQLPSTIQVLSRDSLPASGLVKRTDQPGLYALGFKNLLYLSYRHKKKQSPTGFSLRINGIDGVPFSIINLQTEYAFFDSNGIVVDPQSLIFEGYWADAGAIANLLPSDYELK